MEYPLIDEKRKRKFHKVATVLGVVAIAVILVTVLYQVFSANATDPVVEGNIPTLTAQELNDATVTNAASILQLYNLLSTAGVITPILDAEGNVTGFEVNEVLLK